MFVLKLFSRNGLWGIYFNVHVISIQLTALKFFYTMLNKSISGHEKRSHLRLLIAELQVFFFTVHNIIFFFFPEGIWPTSLCKKRSSSSGIVCRQFRSNCKDFFIVYWLSSDRNQTGEKKEQTKRFRGYRHIL